MHLSRIQQGKDESLRSYVKRFNLEAGQIPDLPDGVTFDNFIRGLKKGSFKFDLVKKSVRTMAKVLDEAEAFIHATEICSVPKEPRGSDIAEPAAKKENFEKKSRPNGTWAIAKESDRAPGAAGQKRSRTYDRERFEYNTDMYTILMDVGSKYEIDRPFPMKSPPESRDPKMYCHFYGDIGHDTKECKSLKRALDGLAAKAFLKSYISRNIGGSGKPFYKENKSPPSEEDGNHTDPECVAVISGGMAAEGPTMRGQKDYAKRLGQVMLSGKATSDPFPKVEIGEADRGKIATPHDDPLVIELKIANLRVRRILVDTRSLSDIISLECLNRLQHDPSKIEKIHYPIIGFGGSIIHPIGIISLPLRMGNKKEFRQMDVRFLIVEDITAYNVILGRPTLNRAKAVTVTHLMLLKFVCDDGSVSTIHGDQQQARDCYLTTLSPEAWGSGEEQEVLGNKRKCSGTHPKSLKETLTISAAHIEERRPEPCWSTYFS
ncbi:uncharacterized protein [Spinacia oleracea]|uniref:Retrotransposon gag domain-containing protein n=1 Tax=Spinacia oleracea TaxID=3562 RepID=A0ABM3RJH5_SPIOL|nr:uncharacterized protein LOC130470169 [Spinacia oleracea]